MGPKRVTLSDVAAASGVSRTTVSFVLNDSPKHTISPATRERVRRVAHELGYAPHGLAKALREGSSRIVVLAIGRGLEGNYSRSYIRGLDEELAAHDHVLVVRYGQTSGDWTQRVIDALYPRAILHLAEGYLTGHELDDGGWDHGMAAHTAIQVRHLAERGHTGIAMALPAEGNPLGAVRLRFAQEAAAMLGLEPLVPLDVPRDRAGAGAALDAFMASHRSVTAIAAFDDELALRTLAAMRSLALAAPGDLAIIGYDDTENGALAEPALTTVHIDAETHGRIAARTVLGLSADGLAPPPGRVIVRDTV